MAIEKKWEAISPRPFLASGTNEGVITLASTLDFKVKQAIILKQGSNQRVDLEVKRIISDSQLAVGKVGDIKVREDLTSFTAGATIEAHEQKRNEIPDKEYERAVFDEEPIVAKRVILVDPSGRRISSTNPLPIAPVGEDENLRQQILKAADRQQEFQYLDVGLKTQRVSTVDYVSPSLGTGPGFTARKTITYSLVGTRYVVDTINWTLV